MTTSKIRFIGHAMKWRDKINGNTYHSVRITRCKDGAVIVAPFQYGYGDQYRYSALNAMLEAGWIPKKYGAPQTHGGNLVCLYERENNYPIHWTVEDGLKRDVVANGKI